MPNNLNPSGVKPFDKKVLVRMDQPFEEAKTAGGMRKVGEIWIPEKSADQMQFAEINGLIVEMGVNAFGEAEDEARARDRDPDIPKPGTRVTLARYAGVLINSKQTKDNNEYRLCNDEDIVAILEDE